MSKRNTNMKFSRDARSDKCVAIGLVLFYRRSPTTFREIFYLSFSNTYDYILRLNIFGRSRFTEFFGLLVYVSIKLVQEVQS